MEKWTKPPWKLAREGRRFILGSEASDVGFAIFESFDGQPSFAEVEASAILARAAPEIYEALKEAREWLLGWQSAEPYLETIERALAKAGWTPEADEPATPTASCSTVPPIPGSGR